MSFEHFRYYLSAELFVCVPETAEWSSLEHYVHQIEEVCWLVAHGSLLKREYPVFSDENVFYLWRTFCQLGWEIPDKTVKTMVGIQPFYFVTFTKKHPLMVLYQEMAPGFL